jgi:hypothetical protein
LDGLVWQTLSAPSEEDYIMKISDIAFHNFVLFDDLGKSRLEQSRTSGSTMVVPENAPALEIARIVDRTKSPQIILTNLLGEIVGVVIPGLVRKRLAQYGNRQLAESFYDALKELSEDPTERAHDFHHEWLNLERVDDYWCSKGRHYTEEDPCSLHK